MSGLVAYCLINKNMLFQFSISFFLRRSKSVFLLFFLSSFYIQGQLDTSLKSKTPKRSLKIIDATVDFYTTLNGSKTINAVGEQLKNNLYVYYNLTIQNRIKVGKVKFNTYYFNEFGLRNFKDSIITISEDLYNLKNSVSIPIQQSRFAINFSINSKSQFWKHYTFKKDSNNKYVKSLYTAYLSPGYTVYSGGIRYNFWDRSSIEIGLASGRTTKILNQDIFKERKASKLYGLENGELRKTVLGFQIIITIATKKLFKNCYLEQFSQVFMNKDSLPIIRSYNVDVNNAFHYLLLKYIRFSFRTKFFYDRTVYEKPTVVQQFSIGFYLNNQLQ